MSTEDLYQEDVDSLDDEHSLADEAGEHEPAYETGYGDEPSWPETETDVTSEPETPPEPAGFEDLALDLTLRCGELRLTLGELRRLDAGTILEINGVAPGHATLCHGDRVVAEGELVDVDGRLGLQITRMAAYS